MDDVSHAASRESFALHLMTGESGLQQSPMLNFREQYVEEDFLRLRTRGRAPVALVAYVLLSIFFISRAATVDTNLEFSVTSSAICVAGAVLEIGFVLLAPKTDLAKEVGTAYRHERIVTATAMLLGIVIAATNFDVRRSYCVDAPHYDSCIHDIALIVVVVVFTSVVFAPRLPLLFAANATTLLTAITTAIVNGGFNVMDTVSVALLLTAFTLVLTVVAIAAEIAARTHFVSFVRLRQANLIVVDASEVTNTILSAALPSQLVQPGSSDMTFSQQTINATVCITDVHDFCVWSTLHLADHVVHILHALLTTFDGLVAAHDGVERVMTYGDSYVVCAGLLCPLDDHVARVMLFAEQQHQSAMILADNMAQPFATRTSVCSGPVVGGLVGEDTARYVIAGAAVECAHAKIAECEPNGVVVSQYQPDEPVDGVVQGDDEDDGEMTRSVASRPSLNRDVDFAKRYKFSPVWLTFSDEAVQQDMQQQRANATLSSRLTAALPIIVWGTALLVVLIEVGSDNPRRHHVGWAMGPLAAAAVFAATFFIVDCRGVHLPVALEVVLVATSVAAGMLALWFVGGAFLHAHVDFAAVLLVPVLFRRLSWLSHALLQFAVVGLPTLVHVALVHVNRDQHAFQAFAVQLVLLAAALRYLEARVECLRHIAASEAARALEDAQTMADHQQALLCGLVPAYALSSIDVTRLREGTDLQPQLGELVLHYLVLLQLRFDASIHRLPGFQAITTIWRIASAALRQEGAGVLEIVQAAGDAFAVAGPFVGIDDDGDDARLTAARAVVRLLRCLAERLHEQCTFAAIASGGAAYGALIGANKLTYRLIGPAVRESDALLGTATGMPGAVAFATEAFKHIERDYTSGGRSATPRWDSYDDDDDDEALRDDISDDDDLPPVAPPMPPPARPAVGPALHTLPESDDVSALYGPPALWRVRGVGSTLVTAIHLGVNREEATPR
jgi:class 3 adenylate cyclase